MASGPIKGTAPTPGGSRPGPGRERDDHRPRAQRPPARVRPGDRRGHRPARGRAAPRPRPPREHRDGTPARRSRGVRRAVARAARGHLPPASVSGAPKSSALRIIDALEPVPRGPYCGAIGWVDGDEAVLAVGIRTFWWTAGVLRFGTGAGITWGATPRASGRRRSSRRTASSASPRAHWSHEHPCRHDTDVREPHREPRDLGRRAPRGTGEVALSAVDHGVTVGDGVFETCAVFDGRAFALTRHLRRLARSAAGLGLDAPDERRVLDGVEAVLAEADARTRAGAGPVGRLRITVTAGVGPLGSGRTPASRPSSSRSVPRSSTPPAARCGRPGPERALRRRGAQDDVVRGERRGARRRRGQGRRRGAPREHGRRPVRGHGANVFVERGGELVTPPLSSGCLAGITRELLSSGQRRTVCPRARRAPASSRSPCSTR